MWEKLLKKWDFLIDCEHQKEEKQARKYAENCLRKYSDNEGVCVSNLVLEDLNTSFYGKTTVTFSSRSKNRTTNSHENSFSPGDIVGVYSSNTKVLSAVATGVVVNHRQVVTVAIDVEKGSDLLHVDNKSNNYYNLLLYANDVTYQRLKRIIKTLQDVPCYLPGVVFKSILEKHDNFRSNEISNPISNIKWCNLTLNDIQKKIVLETLNSRYISLIHGPPGTGKTTTIIEIIHQIVSRQNGKVLVCGPSNISVDNIAELLVPSSCKIKREETLKFVRLGHPARISDTVEKYSLDALLLNSDHSVVLKGICEDIDDAMYALGYVKMNKVKKKSRYQSIKRNEIKKELSMLRKDLKKYRRKAFKSIFYSSDVVLSTLTGISLEDSPLSVLFDKDACSSAGQGFDVVIIDECSQATEVSCWMAILLGKKLILAGDHCQLPPTILSDVAMKEGLGRSLMQRIIEDLPQLSSAVHMLKIQYRMNSRIMAFSSEFFYENSLIADESVENHTLSDIEGVVKTDEDTLEPLVVIDTAGCDYSELPDRTTSDVDDREDMMSKGNLFEAEIVVYKVRQLVRKGVPPNDIAVIVPYNLQVFLIKTIMMDKNFDIQPDTDTSSDDKTEQLLDSVPDLVEVRSVDGFQGREKEAIIVSLVRSNNKGIIGFLSESRRLNVALTRARRHLCLIYDSSTLLQSKDPFLTALVNYMCENAIVKPVSEYSHIIGSAKIDLSFVYGDEQPSRSSNNKQASVKKSQKKQKDKKFPLTSLNVSTEQTTPVQKIEDESCFKSIKNNDERYEHFLEILSKFARNNLEHCHEFPSSLNAYERKIIHQISESLNLNHSSHGDGDERRIIVKKPYECIATNHNDTVSVAAINNLSIGETQNISDDLFDNDIVIDTTRESKRNAECSLSNLDEKHCKYCMKIIPSQSLKLHELRCPQKRNKAPEKKHNKSTPLTKELNSLEKIDEDDFDGLMQAVADIDGICNMKKCKTIVTILGETCTFCSRRYCFQHSLAEVHGCGNLASRKAKQVIRQEGKLYPGSGKPNHKLNANERSHLQHRLSSKLEKMQSDRVSITSNERKKKKSKKR